MNENNFESLDEQQIAELYGDVLDEPAQVAGWFRDANDCARNTSSFLGSLRCGISPNNGRGYD